ncbi:uncharacterized protein LOC144907111 [Branchiostoma floridae x Branchiostoma belcheri]
MFDMKTVQNYDEFEKSVKSFENVASAVPDEDVIDIKPKLQSGVKLRIKDRVSHKIREMAQIIFTDKVLNPEDRELFHKMAECFGRFQAALRKAERGCVFCHLDFADVGCFDTFWRGYSDGSLSDTLTRELITDDMRAAEGGADLYIHVRVLHSATEEGDFSDQDPSGTAGRGSPHPGPSGEHTGQGPPAPGSGNHGDDTPPGYHGDGPGGLQVSGGGDVIQVKQEPAEQVLPCCMMGNVKSEIKCELAGPFLKREETELDRQLAAVADSLGSMWERLALSLGFNSDYIRDLTARQPPSLRPHQLICDWMEKNLLIGDVTLERLVQALRDAGIHQVADAAASGQLFETAEQDQAEKEKPEDDLDAMSPGRQTSPAKGKEKGRDSSSEEEPDDRKAEKELALSLGFNTAYIRDLTARQPPSLRPHQLICDWMERNAGDVTLDQLVQALRNAGIHEVADAAASGELFLTEAESEAAKRKPDGDMDTGGPEGGGRLPDDSDGESSESGGSNMEASSVSEEDRSTSLDSGSHISTVSLLMYPTGDDALAWNDCLQDFFKTDEDTARSIQESWPSNLLVKHLIRDRFFHSYLCEYWKQYQTFPGTLSGFVKFVTEVSAKQFCFERGISSDKFKSVFNSHCLVVGKAAFENQSKNLSVHVNKGQLAWGFVRQSGFGWLLPVDSSEAKDAFQFVHDSIRQFLMAHWVAHTVRTQTDCTELLRVCAEKSDHLPITCYSLAHLLSRKDSPPAHLHQFVQLLMKRQEGSDDFNRLLSVIATVAESKQLDILSSLTKCKTRLNVWPGVFSFLPSDIKELALQGRRTHVFQGMIMGDTVDNLASYFPHLECLVRLDLKCLKASSSEWLTLLQGLSSLPATASSVEGGEASSFPPLKVLGFANCNLTDEEILSLTEQLPTLQNLEKIDLTNNDISNKGGLVWLLQGQYRQLQLEVGGNNISSDLVSLLYNRKDASQVTKLDLTSGENSRSDVTPLRTSDVHLLLQFLPQLPNLQELALCVSCQGEEEAEHINRLYGVRHILKKLKLVNWSLDNMIKLSTQMFQHFHMLETIDLSHNAINDEVVPGLAKCLSLCENLKVVHLTNNDISNKGVLLWLLLGQYKQLQLKFGENVSGDLVSLLCNRKDASQVTKLDLTSVENSRSDVTPLRTSDVHLLLQFLPQLPNLQELALCVSCQGEEEAEHINQLYGVRHILKKLKLKDCSLDNITRLSTQIFQYLSLLEEIDLSHNNISDEAVPGLAEGLGSCQNLKKVNLSHNKLSDRGDFLPPLPNLEEIDLSYSAISDKAVPGLAEGLGSCQSLKKVDLSHNKLSDRGDFLPPLPNLEEIDLSHNAISDEAMPGLAEGLGSCQNLKKVNLSHNKLSDRVDLPPLPNLEEIDLSHNVISDEAMPGLAEGLGSCKNLKKVDLSHNKLSDRGDFLPPLPNLEEIDLSHNAISDEAMPGLAEGLGSCQNLKKVNLSHNKLSDRVDLPPLPNLEEIDLSHNAISDEAMPGLAEGLGSCQNLKKVNLSHNKLSDRVDLPPLPNLEEIDLSNNAISDEAVPGLAEGLGSFHNLKKVDLRHNKLSNVGDLMKAFTNLPILTRVDIQYNSIHDESLPVIAAWLKVSTAVEEVWLYDNRFSAEGVRDFVRTMKGKAYTWNDDLLYDGNLADVGEAVESGGEGARREEQQWVRLRGETFLINVKMFIGHGSKM